jgi:hypothetical protein
MFYKIMSPGEGAGEGREGRGGCVRADATQRPHGLIFTSADGKIRPWVKSRPRGKHGRARTSGR